MNSGATMPIWLSVLMLCAGVGIPIMAALNSGLSARLGSPVSAAFVLFIVGAIATGLVLLVTGAPNPFRPVAEVPFWLGGLLVAFYVLSVTIAAPKIGMANAIFLVLLGQLVSATAIDHFALFGVARYPLNLTRTLGLVLMLGGVLLARKPS
jgi:bacterial/archaeal transporter family-2 protein